MRQNSIWQRSIRAWLEETLRLSTPCNNDLQLRHLFYLQRPLNSVKNPDWHAHSTVTIILIARFTLRNHVVSIFVDENNCKLVNTPVSQVHCPISSRKKDIIQTPHPAAHHINRRKHSHHQEHSQGFPNSFLLCAITMLKLSACAVSAWKIMTLKPLLNRVLKIICSSSWSSWCGQFPQNYNQRFTHHYQLPKNLKRKKKKPLRNLRDIVYCLFLSSANVGRWGRNNGLPIGTCEGIDPSSAHSNDSIKKRARGNL